MIKDIIKRCFKLPVVNTNLMPLEQSDTEKSRYHHNSDQLPIDSDSPWPKFRGNAAQTGRANILPQANQMKPWSYQTGKGIFSSPVIDKEGTIYIGSADHYFYALTEKGGIKWRFATHEIIDSSALLDNRHHVYFGSGDGYVYCLDRNTGTQVWKFKAHTTRQVEEMFGIKTYNLNWFEGNIAMLKDGTILAPNDNYLVYGLDWETGECRQAYLGSEMIWSCPAVNTATDRVFFGSCFIAAVNMFCYQGSTGKKVWTSGGLGTVSASPLLTSTDPNGAVLFAGFDGILRALSQKNGKQLWAFGTHDHIYGSPAQLSGGTIVQASCSGTLYGLAPKTGKPIWSFDTTAPVRSSPVVDGRDQIYFGSGEGRLYCIDKNGKFRWAYQCIDGHRNDLNGSPALGRNGVYIAGESGEIFFIPYDYPLTEQGRKDHRSIVDPDPDSQKDGSFLYYTTPFGKLTHSLPEMIDANEPITLTHVLREKEQTLLSAIDPNSLKVSFSNNSRVKVKVSANRKFITLLPEETWTDQTGGNMEIEIEYQIRTHLKRFGLKFFWGKKTHRHKETLRFSVSPYQGINNSGPVSKMPFNIPKDIGERGTVFEISRLSCPNPTMLPSYNQIGFDSLHYLAAIVKGEENRAVLWVVPGKLDEKTGKTIVEPALKDVFVLNLKYDNGLVTLYNYQRFMLSFVGSWDMPFGMYRIASRVDTTTGTVLKEGALNAEVFCDDIKFYGRFLKLMGMSDLKTGKMQICGGTDFAIWTDSGSEEKTEDFKIDVAITPTQTRAVFSRPVYKKNAHVFGILLIHTQTGEPVAANYARSTKVQSDENGLVTSVCLDYKELKLTGHITGFIMVDTLAVHRHQTEVKSG